VLLETWNCYCRLGNLGCAVRNTTVRLGENRKMSCPVSAKMFSNHRFMSILIVMLLIPVCMFAQTDASTSQGNAASKKTATGKSKKQSGAKSEEKKTEAQPTGTEKAPADDGDQEEAKGPWHGLTWRLIGPFRGGRVLAVSGVVGDQHTY
jgi:hypothetical protein